MSLEQTDDEWAGWERKCLVGRVDPGWECQALTMSLFSTKRSLSYVNISLQKHRQRVQTPPTPNICSPDGAVRTRWRLRHGQNSPASRYHQLASAYSSLIISNCFYYRKWRVERALICLPTTHLYQGSKMTQGRSKIRAGSELAELVCVCLLMFCGPYENQSSVRHSVWAFFPPRWGDIYSFWHLRTGWWNVPGAVVTLGRWLSKVKVTFTCLCTCCVSHVCVCGPAEMIDAQSGMSMSWGGCSKQWDMYVGGLLAD